MQRRRKSHSACSFILGCSEPPMVLTKRRVRLETALGNFNIPCLPFVSAVNLPTRPPVLRGSYTPVNFSSYYSQLRAVAIIPVGYKL